MSRVPFDESASSEAEAAALWYEAQEPGLGIEFILELDAAVERAVENPDAYQEIYKVVSPEVV